MLKKNNFIFLFIISWLFSVFISSCDSRPRGVLNSKKMENLMVDLHVLEGSLRASGSSYGSGAVGDKYYESLYEKYGITRADFDSNLVWYTKHPKEFGRIYQNVLARVDSLGSDVRKRKFHPIDSTALTGVTNLWTKGIKYVFTKDSVRNKLHFEIQNVELLPKDLYELSFLHRVAKSDSSTNPHAVMYVNYSNNIVDSIYTKLHNDSILRRYTLLFKARKNRKVVSLSGYLLGNDSSKGIMNAYVDSVKLIRKFNPFNQDSIRAAIRKIEADTVRKKAKVKQPDFKPKKTVKKPGNPH